MHDIRSIRQSPGAFENAMSRRGVSVSSHLLQIDRELRAADQALNETLARRNTIAQLVARAKQEGQDVRVLIQEGKDLHARLPNMERVRAQLAKDLQEALEVLPNIAHADVPDGIDETQNVVVKTVGSPQMFPWSKPHWDFAPALGLDTDRAARLSGARFSVLRGPLAQIERALGQFMMDLHGQQHGREEISVPHIVRSSALYGTGQLPKFSEDLFAVGDQQYLIPTAEVPLTNLIAGETLPCESLPWRWAALTPCYRAEAGSAGRDTRGLLRQHQFYKAEMVTICLPEHADAEHTRMIEEAEHVLELLELPYRRLLLCAGDMGFSSAKTMDLEVWMPGQSQWREISSISTCGDFQSRRMQSRLKGRKDLPHTLNGSGVAVGRALAAVLENHLQEDGRVRLPAALKPYLRIQDPFFF